MTNRNRMPPRHRAGGTGSPVSRAQRKAERGAPPQPIQLDPTTMNAVSRSIEAAIDTTAAVLAAAAANPFRRKGSRR